MIGQIRRRSGGAHGGGGVGVGGYKIDQTGTYTASADMVRDRDASVINDIRAASHLYIGTYSNNALQCKQVSDSNKALYADGTSVTYNNGENLFMKLPQFWWKVIPDANDADICEFKFTMSDPNDNTWNEWEGDTFIGSYVGFLTGGYLFSQSGLNAGAYTRTNLDVYRSAARAWGNGFSCLSYEVMRIMALLAFGYLGSVSAYQTFGTGGGTLANYYTGNCNSLGMSDGKIGNFTSFWGLEDYVTGIGLNEFIDNLIFADGNGTINVLDTDDLSIIKRSFQIPLGQSGNRWITKIILGSYGDVSPKESVTSRIYTQYTCYINISYNANYGFSHVCTTNSNAGLISLRSHSATSGVNSTTSRLCYKGNYQIIT